MNNGSNQRPSIIDLNRLVSFFLPNNVAESSESIPVVEFLIGARKQYPEIGNKMSVYIEELVSKFSQQLQLTHPTAPAVGLLVSRLWFFPTGIAGET